MKKKFFLLLAVIMAATVHAMAWDYQIDYATMANGEYTTPPYEEGSTITVINNGSLVPIWNLPTYYDYSGVNPIGTQSIVVKGPGEYGVGGSGKNYGITVPPAQAATYALTVNSGSGSGSYTSGTVVNIAANAAPSGKTFDKWTGDTGGVGDVNASSTTYTMGSTAATITATYKDLPPNQYILTLNVNPWNAGMVSGGGTFLAGSQQTVRATANDGYIFVNWTKNGVVVSTNASYTLILDGNVTLVANFEPIPVTKYSVTFIVNVSDAIITLNGVTNLAGEYSFLIEPGEYNYTVIREGYTDATGTVTVTNQNVSVTVDLITGIETIETGIKIYAEGSSLRVESGVVITSIAIYNLSGQTLHFEKVGSNQVRIDALPQGILIVRITFQGGENQNKKILIR